MKLFATKSKYTIAVVKTHLNNWAWLALMLMEWLDLRYYFQKVHHFVVTGKNFANNFQVAVSLQTWPYFSKYIIGYISFHVFIFIYHILKCWIKDLEYDWVCSSSVFKCVTMYRLSKRIQHFRSTGVPNKALDTALLDATVCPCNVYIQSRLE